VPREEKSIVSIEAINNDWYLRNGYYGIYSAAGGSSTSWSGEAMNAALAMNHSVVWACRKLISETVAFLPLIMFQQLAADSNTKEAATKHPMYRALLRAPNPEMSAMTFRETETGHCLMDGNAYAQIMRRSGTGVAMEMYPIMNNHIKPDREKTGKRRLVYVVKEGNSADKVFTVDPTKPQDIFHMRGMGDNGLEGFSVIEMARQSIGLAVAVEKNLGGFYMRGGRIPFVLQSDQNNAGFKNAEAMAQWRTEFEQTYSVPNRSVLLPGGIKYERVGVSMKDSQLLESRLFSIHEICRWFGMPPHLVGDLSRATFNNIEELALEFVKLTLTGWLNRWEQELWRCVLTPDEKAQSKEYFWRHDLNALLRGDFTTRMAGYATMLQNGVASQDEVRAMEDWNPIPNGAGSGYHVQLNMQTLPPDGGPLLPPKGPGGEPGSTPAPAQNAPKKPKTPKKPDSEVVAAGEEL
jgi:HK97 family phage portal protein